MSVGRICVRAVDTASDDESVQAAAQRMHARNVGSLVVINKACEPVGMVTDRDLTVRVLADGLDAVQTRISEVMTRHPKTVREETPIEEALRLMRAGAFRRLPVVGQSGKLVGLVTLDDVLDLLTEEFREIRSILEQETPHALAQP
ncbi:MAG: CBS domain-containing protein [Planctomycetia bacterium]|nr:CBS domain-containing protein [Planctomycetia bacterium]